MIHGLETIKKINQQVSEQPATASGQKELFGVFFMSDHMDIGIEDQSIHIFDSLDAAQEFVVRGLVQAGLLREVNGRWITTSGSPEAYFTKEEAIFETQDTFSGMEFFHIYKAKDHR